jgi:hypothetical protein
MDEALRAFIRERAGGRCEYCRLHQDEYEFQTFHVEHIIAKQHGGADYLPVPDPLEEEFQACWEQLRLVLEDAPQKLTRQDILAEWPPDYAKPQATKLWRWLDGAVQRGLIACEGAGRKADPFRYWLPEREAVWKEDPLYEIFEAQRRHLNLPFESLQQNKKKLADAAEPRFSNDVDE